MAMRSATSLTGLANPKCINFSRIAMLTVYPNMSDKTDTCMRKALAVLGGDSHNAEI
jgi:hypothetical protein